MLALLSFLSLSIPLALTLSLVTSYDSGMISARRVGGLTFVKVGRFGASFYASKGGKS